MYLDNETLFQIHCELYRIFVALNYIKKLHIPDGFESEDMDQAVTSLFRIKAILDEKEREHRLPLNIIQGNKSRGIQFMMENIDREKAVS